MKRIEKGVLGKPRRWGGSINTLIWTRSSAKNLSSTFLWYDTDGKENEASNNCSIVVCVLVAAVTFSLSRCLATMGRYISRHTGQIRGTYEICRWDGLRCRDIHTQFHKDLCRHSDVNRGDTPTRRQHDDRVSLLSFLQNKGRCQKYSV
jgi:hypothetical protein